MQIGKQVRLNRIFNDKTKRAILVPLDHGVSVGPIVGIVDIHSIFSSVAENGADAIVMHKGYIGNGRCNIRRDLGLIVHLSASTTLSLDPTCKTLIATVEEAIRLGADGVSVHINLGAQSERNMLADLGRVATVAGQWGIPLLAMVYARGPHIQNEFDPVSIAHCARVAAELGADAVKVPYTGDIDSFAHVVNGCGIPVLIAGGAKKESTLDFLNMVCDSIKAGGSGLSIGRNIFQGKDPAKLVRTLRGLIHNDWGIEAALNYIEDSNN